MRCEALSLLLPRDKDNFLGSWAVRYTPLTAAVRACDHQNCSARRYRLSVHVQLCQLGIPFAMLFGGKFVTATAAYTLRPCCRYSGLSRSGRQVLELWGDFVIHGHTRRSRKPRVKFEYSTGRTRRLEVMSTLTATHISKNLLFMVPGDRLKFLISSKF